MDPIIILGIVTGITSLIIVVSREAFNHIKNSECTKNGVKIEMNDKTQTPHNEHEKN